MRHFSTTPLRYSALLYCLYTITLLLSNGRPLKAEKKDKATLKERILL